MLCTRYICTVFFLLRTHRIDAAVDFYSRAFRATVHKRRPGYANFEIADPPMKLVLFEVNDRGEGSGVRGLEALTKAMPKPVLSHNESPSITKPSLSTEKNPTMTPKNRTQFPSVIETKSERGKRQSLPARVEPN